MTTEFFIFGLARLTRICNPSTDLETSLKVMRYWKFSQKTKLKQKFFTDGEKEVGNFFQDWDHSAGTCGRLPRNIEILRMTGDAPQRFK